MTRTTVALLALSCASFAAPDGAWAQAYIEAGLAAGMMTIAAAYGYITADDCASRWGAHEIAADTQELAKIVLKAVNLLHR